MSKRKVQSISFNLEDPFEKELLEHAMTKGFFSKYVKRLIQRDKEFQLFTSPMQMDDKPLKRKADVNSFL